jgi:hypothetical protein
VAALTLALNAPLPTTVIGLVTFGILHNVLELRYVLGRFGAVFDGPFAVLLVSFVAGIAAVRLAGAYLGTTGPVVEILLGYAVLAVGVRLGLTGWARWSATALLAVAAVVSLSHPAYHFVVLTHLHNVVPLVFLWEWAARLPVRAAWVFRSVQLGWVVVVPLLVLGGVIGSGASGLPGVVAGVVGDGSGVVATSAWPGAAGMATRFLVVFAFLQTMHYVVWVWFLPRSAPEAARAFESRWPALTGRRLWGAGLVAAAVLGILLVTDYRQGRVVYSGLATFHAYLEFPVVMALLAGRRFA